MFFPHNCQQRHVRLSGGNAVLEQPGADFVARPSSGLPGENTRARVAELFGV